MLVKREIPCTPNDWPFVTHHIAEKHMKTEVWLLAGTLAAVGSYLLWAVYQVQFKNRIDLIRLGSGPLPGAGQLKRQFAVLWAVHAATCGAAALTMALTNTAAPAVWVFAGVSCALAVRRQLLIRAIEIKVERGISE